jgi:hypothetical protein
MANIFYKRAHIWTKIVQRAKVLNKQIWWVKYEAIVVLYSYLTPQFFNMGLQKLYMGHFKRTCEPKIVLLAAPGLVQKLINIFL